MSKTILLTGSTDGIGLQAAKVLAGQDHHLLLHGRNPEKLGKITKELSAQHGKNSVSACVADLSEMNAVRSLTQTIINDHGTLDVLINNAGIFKTPTPITKDGLDIRFVVNTLAPYLLSKNLLPIIKSSGRIINLSSAAQAPVDLAAMAGQKKLTDSQAYAQSKLALTMWSRHMALSMPNGPTIVSVNPASLLATKMVKEAYGMNGKDVNIGRDIIVSAALSDEFEGRSGDYYDNDIGAFGLPHPDALDTSKCASIITAIEDILKRV